MTRLKRGTVQIADDVELEVASFGSGESVVVIQTALFADELLPMSELLADSTGLESVHLTRRGYGRSSPAEPGTTMPQMAEDCRAVLDRLHVAPAHVVGVSFSCVVALLLAARSPSHVRSLTVVEPPPLDGPSAAEFRSSSAKLVATAEAHGGTVALEAFMTTLTGPAWRESWESTSPGAVAGLERHAQTFFGTDLPALLGWRADAVELAVRCPVLSVGGGTSGPWFVEARQTLKRWLPHSEEATIDGAGHLVATTHPRELAGVVAQFVRGVDAEA